MKLIRITSGLLIIFCFSLCVESNAQAPRRSMSSKSRIAGNEISFNPSSLGRHLFKLVKGDCETGKVVLNEGGISIGISPDGRSVYANIYAKSWEPDSNWSEGEVYDSFIIYEAEAEQRIVGIVGDQYWYFEPYYDYTKHSPETPEMIPQSCPWQFIVNARKEKQDICGEGYVEVNGGSGSITIRVK